MTWRDIFLRHFGPGLLSGITAGDWARVLIDNGFAVAPDRLPKAATITAQSLQNSAVAWHERRRYGPAVGGVAVPPPVFVLGHWRGGTTHLHYLLAADDRFWQIIGHTGRLGFDEAARLAIAEERVHEAPSGFWAAEERFVARLNAARTRETAKRRAVD